MFDISVCVVSRNDNYGGHQLARLQTFVSGLAQWRTLYSWDIELVITEWNPPRYSPKLREVTDCGSMPVRWYEVPKEIHYSFDNSDIFPIFPHIGVNVSMRRARKNWWLVTGQDVLFSEELVRVLTEHDGNEDLFYRATLHMLSRRIVPPGDIRDQMKFCEENVCFIKKYERGDLFTQGCGDFLLMHRDKWGQIRGFPELPLFSIYLDGWVMGAAASFMDQAVFHEPARLYHIYHETRGAFHENLPRLSRDEYTDQCLEMIDKKGPLEINDENWGLASCREVQIADNAWRLER